MKKSHLSNLVPVVLGIHSHDGFGFLRELKSSPVLFKRQYNRMSLYVTIVAPFALDSELPTTEPFSSKS